MPSLPSADCDTARSAGEGQPLTVLFNTYPVAFDCPGGGEVQLLQYRAALERRGVRVLLHDQWRPQFAEADIVHYFSVQGWAAPFCQHVRRLGKPVVVSTILWLGENKYDYDLAAIGQVLHSCDLALPNSLGEGERLAAWYGIAPDKFIPVVNGVDEAFFVPGDPALFRSHFGIDTPFLLSVANIEPRKNQLRLIQASRECGLPLLLLGRVRDAAYWEACQSAMHDGVRYLGPVTHGSELHRAAYAACQAFVLPTLLETPGLAALEAAAQGAPLCLTREGCTEEYFEGQAVYVDPESEASIRDGLIAVQREMRCEARSRFVRERYTWDIAAGQLETIYRRLLP